MDTTEHSLFVAIEGKLNNLVVPTTLDSPACTMDPKTKLYASTCRCDLQHLRNT